MTNSRNIIKVKENETLGDIAVLQNGKVSGMIGLALMNNLSLTQDLTSGMILEKTEVIDKDVIAELKGRGARPASGVKTNPDDPFDEGIGFWKVLVDFIVQ